MNSKVDINRREGARVCKTLKVAPGGDFQGYKTPALNEKIVFITN